MRFYRLGDESIKAVQYACDLSPLMRSCDAVPGKKAGHAALSLSLMAYLSTVKSALAAHFQPMTNPAAAHSSSACIAAPYITATIV